jgi:hypothetical protein
MYSSLILSKVEVLRTVLIFYLRQLYSVLHPIQIYVSVITE